MWLNFNFPSPIGVIFSLIFKITLYNIAIYSFRLLSELYSHLFHLDILIVTMLLILSVSYRSYILTYFSIMSISKCNTSFFFFPSPIGVIFSLISKLAKVCYISRTCTSVSYRSYILTYFYIWMKNNIHKTTLPSPIGVIFSLIFMY